MTHAHDRADGHVGPPKLHAQANRAIPEPLGVEVRSIIRSRACSTAHCEGLPGDLLLGVGGLGLDSVAVVELLIACEERFGVALAATLLDGPPLDVATLIAQIDGTQRSSAGLNPPSQITS